MSAAGAGIDMGAWWAADVVGTFQAESRGKWRDYAPKEDRILKHAYMAGHANARFFRRGRAYEYSFERMVQINMKNGLERSIRPPLGMRPPTAPALPAGAVSFVTVRPGQPGLIIEMPSPSDPGAVLAVAVPATAKPGQRMAVPLPAEGEASGTPTSARPVITGKVYDDQLAHCSGRDRAGDADDRSVESECTDSTDCTGESGRGSVTGPAATDAADAHDDLKDVIMVFF